MLVSRRTLIGTFFAGVVALFISGCGSGNGPSGITTVDVPPKPDPVTPKAEVTFVASRSNGTIEDAMIDNGVRYTSVAMMGDFLVTSVTNGKTTLTGDLWFLVDGVELVNTSSEIQSISKTKVIKGQKITWQYAKA